MNLAQPAANSQVCRCAGHAPPWPGEDAGHMPSADAAAGTSATCYQLATMAVPSAGPDTAFEEGRPPRLILPQAAPGGSATGGPSPRAFGTKGYGVGTTGDGLASQP